MKVPFVNLERRNDELGGAYENAFRRVRQQGRYVLGEYGAKFEQEFAAYCGARQCVGVGNGLDALSLALRAYGVGPGDQVIVPAHTFVATWLAVSNIGAEPVGVDIDPETFNIDPARIEDAITEKTAAIIVVHLYGQVAPMERIVALARRYGVKVIEDAAQAHGAMYQGRRTGTLADAAAFSFYPTKNLGCLGDGGAVVTDDESVADQIRLLSNYGSSAKYVHEIAGVNSRLDEVQAAFLRINLPCLDEWNKRRGDIAAKYIDAMSSADLILPTVPGWTSSVWHIFAVRVRDRQQVMQALGDAGIGTLIHYPIPPHRQSAYVDMVSARREFPVSQRVCDELLSLPMDPYLTEPEVDYVVNTILRTLADLG